MEAVTQEHIDLVDGMVVAFVTRKGILRVDRDALRGAALESLARSAQRYDRTLACQSFAQFAGIRMWFAMLDELRELNRGTRNLPARRAAAAASGQPLAPPIRTVSIETPVASGDDGDLRYADILAGGDDPADVVVARAQFAEMLAAILALPDREQEVLIRTLEGDLGQAIADDLGVTEGRVSQIRRDAIRNLPRPA